MTDVLAAPGPSVASAPAPSHYPYFGVTPNGASWPNQGFSSYQDAVLYYDTQFGGCTVYRTFSSGSIGSWVTGQVSTVRTSTNATVHHSFKTWDESQVTAWMETKPDNGLDAFLTYFHEPENDGFSTAQIAEWQQRCSRMIELRDATGRTDIKCGPVLMSSWTLNPASGRDFWRDWYVGPPIPGYTPPGYPTGYNEMDFLGWDPYNAPITTATVYSDPETGILDGTHSIMDILRITGRPGVIGEFGSILIADDGGAAGRAQWITDYMQYCVDTYAAEGIRWLSVCYYSDTLLGTTTPINGDALALDAISPFMYGARTFYGLGGTP